MNKKNICCGKKVLFFVTALIYSNGGGGGAAEMTYLLGTCAHTLSTNLLPPKKNGLKGWLENPVDIVSWVLI